MKIVVECLRCHHVGEVDPADLPTYGLHPDAALATLTRRLKCSECGGRALLVRREAAGKTR